MADYTANTWQDRVTVGGNRFTDQTGKAYTFTPAPEQVVAEGTPFSAAWMNHIESGIGSGGLELFTCTTTGTVHALTGGALNNLKFVADVAFEDGDTFTVNGVAVTAQTQDGEPLPGGYFAAGAVVTAFLNGTTLNFKSGGAALNFKVVGGTTQPENPSEITIWLNTASAITSWAFSSTEPTAASEGLVWIQTGIESVAPFNALKRNSIMLYPRGAKIYTGSLWSDLEAQVYSGGTWTPLINETFVYNYGDQCTDITGGWKVYSGTVSAVFDEDSVYVRNNSGSGYSRVGTTNKIDLTGVKQVGGYGSATSANANGGSFIVLSDQTSSGIVASVTTAIRDVSTTPDWYYIDTSELSGEYYIGAQALLYASMRFYAVKLVY